MDHSNQRPYSPIQYRKIDNISQVSNYSAATAIPIKPVDLFCNLHADQPCNNYCVQTKCFQPLCAECIQVHLLHHKKNGYSDLSVKSMRGVRKDCVSKLAFLIQELLKRLEHLEVPPSPENIMEQFQIKVQQAQKEAHQIIQHEFSRLREQLRSKISESTTILRSMSDIHIKLENIIEQLKETCNTLSDGKRGNQSLPECIRNTLTLNDAALVDSFQKEGMAYESRRRKLEFQVIFNPQQFKIGLNDSIKIRSSKSSVPSQASFSRQKYKNNTYEEQISWDNSGVTLNLTLPTQADPQQNIKLLHFFETGSNRLHLVNLQSRKKPQSKVIPINQFIVPSFHASIISQTGQFIYLSGGLVQINVRSKSPLFTRYNVKTNVTKKEFAKVIPRSSHTLCQDKNGDIYILGGYGQSQREDQSPYLNVVQRVNQRTGKVEVQADSKWGGSNIAFRCRDLIVKACQEGIQLYNPKQRQWITAQIQSKNINEYIFYKSAGYAILSDSEILIFGGYQNDLRPTDVCFLWKLLPDGSRPIIQIKELDCKLPTAEGFDNGKAVVDERGFYTLQNIEDDEQSCVDNERRLLRFDLKEGEGDWKVVQNIAS